MKSYERPTTQILPENLPVILRLDGRAFHSFCRNLEKPFDATFIEMMNRIGLRLCEEIQNAALAYIQSDEISVLIRKKWGSSSWFRNNLQKIVSVSASLASQEATSYCMTHKWNEGKAAIFDARAFVLPPRDVNNYFLWRQLDCSRNSIQMLARSLYSHKDLKNKNQEDVHEMIFQKGLNWNDLPTHQRRGRCLVYRQEMKPVENEYFTGEVLRGSWVVDNEIPKFSQDRGYINDLRTDEMEIE